MCFGQSVTCPHTLLAAWQTETEVYQTPTATSYFASCSRQMIDSCMVTVQKDNTVIIQWPRFEGQKYSSELYKPAGGNLSSGTTRDKTAKYLIYRCPDTTPSGQFSTFNSGIKTRLKLMRTAFTHQCFNNCFSAISQILMFGTSIVPNNVIISSHLAPNKSHFLFQAQHTVVLCCTGTWTMCSRCSGVL